MKPITLIGLGTMILALLAAGPERVAADEIPPEVQAVITKGLDWLVKTQQKDGHWEANGGAYPAAMTGLSGMAMLMEGSTLREGKYSAALKKAVDWYFEPGRIQQNGLIGNPNSPREQGRYMYGHGFSLLFLAGVYGEEDDLDRRKKLEDVLTRAAQFCARAQHQNGGWGYISAADGDRFDEGSVTITQVQALRAARNAGIVVPKEAIDKARTYLEKCTDEQGGVLYRPGQPGGRPALTAAGVSCMFNAGEYDHPIVKKWLKYCQRNIQALGSGGGGFGRHDEYTHYYFAQALYMLGDDGYVKLVPDSKGKESEQLKWSKYRKPTFEHLMKTQNSDGSWNGTSNWSHIGQVYVTAVHLAILQLDKGTLPIYQR